jgi:hypothetical protein
MLVDMLAMAILLGGTTVYAFPNEPRGFGELEWGDPPSWGMEYQTPSGFASALYAEEDTYAEIGEVEGDLFYEFYDEPPRLSAIVFIFYEESEYDSLEGLLIDVFGEPHDYYEDYFTYEVYWFGDITTVSLSYDYVDELGLLEMYSTTIIDEQYEAEQQMESENLPEQF